VITSYAVTGTASAGSTFFIANTLGSLTQTTFRSGFLPVEQPESVTVLLVTSNWSTMSKNPLDMPDLPLFENENPDIRQEASEVIGEWWLTESNSRLAGRTPNEVISAGQGARVRNIIRSLKYISSS
jgi:hypothetical protein